MDTVLKSHRTRASTFELCDTSESGWKRPSYRERNTNRHCRSGARYDKQGRDSTDQQQIVDPAVFFSARILCLRVGADWRLAGTIRDVFYGKPT